jgi:hypothetical protein
MNPKSLVSDAIKLAEGLATAYVNGSASVTLDPLEATVAGKTFTVTPSFVVTAK